MTTVALLGTGRMGSAMARRLVERGLPPTLWNRSSDRAAAIAEELGLETAASPAAAAVGAGIILTTLADEAAVRSTYLGPTGLLLASDPGRWPSR